MVIRMLLIVLAILVFGVSVSFAEPQVFFDEDVGPGNDAIRLPAHPNSDEAFSQFIVSIQEFYIEDFESQPVGTTPDFTIQFGAIDGLVSYPVNRTVLK